MCIAETHKNIFSIFFLFTWIGFTDKESDFCVKSWHGLPNNFRAFRQNWLCTLVTISPNPLVCRLRHLLSISLLCSILLIVLASASPKQNKSMSLLCGPLGRACFSFLSQCWAHTAPSLLSYSPAPPWSCKSQMERLGERKCNTRHSSPPASTLSCSLLEGTISGTLWRCCWASRSCCGMQKGPLAQK